MKRRYPLALLAVAVVACAPPPRPLEAVGAVRTWTARPDQALRAAAASLPGVTLEELPSDEPWKLGLARGPGGPDLVLAELGRDVRQAKLEGRLAQAAPLWRRTRSYREAWPSVARQEDPHFIPVGIATWGLFYNREVLAAVGLDFPRSFAAFEEALAKLSARGVTPIAFASAGDWTVFGWLSYLDIRLNGSEAHRRLLEGQRWFEDPSLTAICERLASWRDRGWLDSAAAGKNWVRALKDLQEGKAAFCLMPSYVGDRFGKSSEIGFAPLPSRGAKPGEIAAQTGFILSASASRPEAAVALIDAYIASPQAISADSPFLPTLDSAAPRGSKAQDLPSILAWEQAKLLRTGTAILPSMDKYLPAQVVADSQSALDRFFAGTSNMDGQALAQALAAAGPKRP